MTTRCHSVFSRRSLVVLSRQFSEVATRRFAIGRPSCVRRISGSAPRLPTKITLLTEPAMRLSRSSSPAPYAYIDHKSPSPRRIKELSTATRRRLILDDVRVLFYHTLCRTSTGVDG